MKVHNAMALVYQKLTGMAEYVVDWSKQLLHTASRTSGVNFSTTVVKFLSFQKTKGMATIDLGYSTLDS
jgi:hypothetical protein